MQPGREADLHQVSRLMSGAVRLSVPSICCNGVHKYDLSFTIFKLPIIQGDSEETVSVSGGDNIRQCEKISPYGHGYRHTAVRISRPNCVRFLFMGLDGEQSVRKEGGYSRQISRSHLDCCCLHK